jgi:hypothetical protein
MKESVKSGLSRDPDDSEKTEGTEISTGLAGVAGVGLRGKMPLGGASPAFGRPEPIDGLRGALRLPSSVLEPVRAPGSLFERLASLPSFILS